MRHPGARRRSVASHSKQGLTGEFPPLPQSLEDDVTGEILSAPVHQQLEGQNGARDDLSQLKGVGPRFAEALQGLGFQRFEQIAHLTPTEIERLDNQLGAFRGRIARDKVVEQADYLARNDIDGFEQKFGKL